jgi:hypothetical protein
MKSKAVLEFEYPEDEDNLRHALKGVDYYRVLVEVSKFIAETKAPKLQRIKAMIDQELED